MTPHLATATVLVSCESDRELPVYGPVGNRFPDVLFLAGSMDLVAGPAAAPLHFLVDVQVVKIQITVAKTGQGLGPGLNCDLMVVAIEAHGVLFFCIGCVEFLGKVLPKNDVVPTAVGIVAGHAIALSHRAVLEFLGFDEFTQLSVAFEAQTG